MTFDEAKDQLKAMVRQAADKAEETGDERELDQMFLLIDLTNSLKRIENFLELSKIGEN